MSARKMIEQPAEATANLIVVSLMIMACSFGCISSHPTADYKADYDVVGEGTGSASVTYTNQSGGTEQRDVRLPWHESFPVRSGDFLYISAQNKNGSGSITIYISINKQTRKTASSEGAYVIASSSYRCCD
jgi:hypothetical protein